MLFQDLIHAVSKAPPTDPLPPERMRNHLTPCAVAALRTVATGHTVSTPASELFSIGRDQDSNELVFDDPSVSRLHCTVERVHLGLQYVDAGSTRGTAVDGRTRASAIVMPGATVTFGALACLALDETMLKAATHLDRLIGVPAQVHAALVAARDTRCIILVAPRGAPHREIVHTLKDSQAPGMAPAGPIATYDALPRREDLERLIDKLRGGWLVLDATEREIRLPSDVLTRILRPADRITLVLAVSDLDTIPAPLYRLHHQRVSLDPITARLRSDAIVTIDRIFRWLQLSLRAADLHRDLVDAIARHPWPGDYTQFADVVAFVGRRFAGKSYADSMRGTYHPASSVNRWALELGVHRSLLGMTT